MHLQKKTARQRNTTSTRYFTQHPNTQKSCAMAMETKEEAVILDSGHERDEGFVHVLSPDNTYAGRLMASSSLPIRVPASRSRVAPTPYTSPCSFTSTCAQQTQLTTHENGLLPRSARDHVLRPASLGTSRKHTAWAPRVTRRRSVPLRVMSNTRPTSILGSTQSQTKQQHPRRPPHQPKRRGLSKLQRHMQTFPDHWDLYPLTFVKYDYN